MNGLHAFFTPLDWGVVGGYLVFTTFVGFCLRGKSATLRDFFLGGRTLPWQAVSFSLVATEVGAIAFLGVPGSVMALQGDCTYLQWAIGSILARILVGLFFVKVFYERDLYSPYDYMGKRIGPSVKVLATVLFTVGSLVSLGARILFAALPLKMVMPLPFEYCVLLIGFFAIAWTLMGGIRTVIWTDVVHTLVIIAAGLTALLWMVGTFESGWATFHETLRSAEHFDGSVIDKLRVFDFSLHPELKFTFWVAIFAVPFMHLNALGVDQTNAQRLFCCRGHREARKAIWWSSLGQLTILGMLLIGAALFVFYREHPPTDPMILTALEWSGGQPGRADLVFPVWMITEMPVALRGLVLSGIIAAAILSLDSLLAALSQTTLSLMRKTDRDFNDKEQARLVRLARFLVVFWGFSLMGVALFLFDWRDRTPIDLPSLAFGITAYTGGPLLGLFLVALLGGGRGRAGGLFVGTLLSIALVIFVREDVWLFFMNDSLATWLSRWPTFELVEGSPLTVKATLASEWMWPLTTLLTMACGWGFRRKIA